MEEILKQIFDELKRINKKLDATTPSQTSHLENDISEITSKIISELNKKSKVDYSSLEK